MQDPIYFAVGDVHGRADHLKKLVSECEIRARERRGRPVFYFLGDIVDRGFQSREALEIVHATLAKHPGSALHLGNHDKWFLDAVLTEGNGPEVRAWLEYGGANTLRSFMDEPSSLGEALRMIRRNHGHLVQMIADARLITDHGRMVFCHAGVDRDRPLSRQDLGTLTWIREPFLDRVGKRHHVVVHGHTIFDDGPVVTENRVSLDTGAYWTGVLSAFMIMPSKRLVSFPQATGGTSNVEVEEIAPRLLDRGEGTAMDRLGEVFEGWKGDSEVSA